MSNRKGPRGVSAIGVALHVVPALAYTAAIFFLGSLPPGAEMTPRVNDKLLHAVGFAAMVPLNVFAVGYLWRSWTPRWVIGVGGALAVALGGLLELYQLCFTARSAEVADWLADTVGIALAAAVIAAYHARRAVDVVPTSEN